LIHRKREREENRERRKTKWNKGTNRDSKYSKRRYINYTSTDIFLRFR
jgi:hypothetical protein